MLGRPSEPLINHRLKNPRTAKTSFLPDFCVVGTHAPDLAYLRAEITSQGSTLFDNVHSMSTVLAYFRGEIDAVPIEEGYKYLALDQAERIARVLNGT